MCSPRTSCGICPQTGDTPDLVLTDNICPNSFALSRNEPLTGDDIMNVFVSKNMTATVSDLLVPQYRHSANPEAQYLTISLHPTGGEAIDVLKVCSWHSS